MGEQGWGSREGFLLDVLVHLGGGSSRWILDLDNLCLTPFPLVGSTDTIL